MSENPCDCGFDPCFVCDPVEAERVWAEMVAPSECLDCKVPIDENGVRCGPCAVANLLRNPKI